MPASNLAASSSAPSAPINCEYRSSVKPVVRPSGVNTAEDARLTGWSAAGYSVILIFKGCQL